MNGGQLADMAQRTADLRDLRVGDRITVHLPGVPAWNVPATDQSATVRDDDHRAALIADATEQMVRGGATVSIERRTP